MIDFASAADEISLTVTEREHWIERMDANPARHPLESRNIARSRMEPLRVAAAIVRAVAKSDPEAIRELVEQQMGASG